MTVYVTGSPSAEPTEDCEDDFDFTLIDLSPSTSTDCDEETTPVVVVVPSSTVITEYLTTTSICDDGTPTTIIVTQVTTEPCETTVADSTSMSTPGVPTTSESLTTFVLTPSIVLPSSTPSTLTSTSAISTPSASSSSSAMTSTPGASSSTSAASSTIALTTSAPTPVATYEICIDINITPVLTSKLTVTPTNPPEPTRTVCVDDHETGEPEEAAIYCGIKGKPAGVGFIAEFIEERSGVPVTEEGCYQFCDVSAHAKETAARESEANEMQSVMESTDGCQAYRFYHNELGAPRCALYGMPVASVVYDIDENQDDIWYDLACGSPNDEVWVTVVPAESTKTTPSTMSTSTKPATSEAVTTSVPVVVVEPVTTETPTTSEVSTTASPSATVTTISDDDEQVTDDDNVVTEPIDNDNGTVSDSGNVDSGNTQTGNNDSFNGNENSNNNDSFNNNQNNDNNNNSGSLVDIDIDAPNN